MWEIKAKNLASARVRVCLVWTHSPPEPETDLQRGRVQGVMPTNILPGKSAYKQTITPAVHLYYDYHGTALISGDNVNIPTPSAPVSSVPGLMSLDVSLTPGPRTLGCVTSGECCDTGIKCPGWPHTSPGAMIGVWWLPEKGWDKDEKIKIHDDRDWTIPSWGLTSRNLCNDIRSLDEAGTNPNPVPMSTCLWCPMSNANFVKTADGGYKINWLWIEI